MSGVLPGAAEKPRYVSAMFGRIAARYDLMNTVMTLGMVDGWRRAVADAAAVPLGGQVLDVGAGPGELAHVIAEQSIADSVVAADFSLPMLRAGSGSKSTVPVRYVAADGQRLPFPDGSFDAVVSAFLVRNLADTALGIREQARVLKPGGRLAILEITPGPPGPLRAPYQLYFRHVVPLLGGLIAGDPSAYTYLPESAAAFLEPERLAELLRAAGLTGVWLRRLGFGTVAITSGMKAG